MSHTFDAVIVGAGAAGLHCAGIAGQRGLRVLLVDHSDKLAEKIRISGGGRCNFTNRDVSPANFLSSNPDFCRSALARYTPQDFIDLLGRHGIAWHEKHKGQLFCDRSSEDVIAMLLRECQMGQVTLWQGTRVGAVQHGSDGFVLECSRGSVQCGQLVVASGGLSIPKIGASDFGYQLARQFGHHIVETRPALAPLTFEPASWARFASLSGLSLPVHVQTGASKARGAFAEDLLFTHRGLSGPAILQISSYWQPGAPLQIDLAPDTRLGPALIKAKGTSTRQLGNVLAELIPRRLAESWLADRPKLASSPLPDLRDRVIEALAREVQAWSLTPNGTEGYRKAEVTAGGVDTRELHSQNLESRRVAGLHFIGEVVDVTGWLGGYNFQWAWASAAACAGALKAP